MIALQHPVIRALAVFIRMVLGGIFLWAGFAKISDPALFAQTILAYQILPVHLIHIFAILIPGIEIITGLFLIFGIWQRSAALISLLLLLSFLIAISINLYRGLDFSCGCFGQDSASGSLISAWVQDIFLMLGSLALIYPLPFTSWGKIRTDPDQPLPQPE